MWQKIKQHNEQRGEILAEMRRILDASETEKRDLTADESGKFDELNTRAESLKTQIDRYTQAHNLGLSIDGANAAGFNPRGPVAGSAPAAGAAETRSADELDAEMRSEFTRYLRGEINAAEARSLTVTGQGVVGTRPFKSDLVVAMKAYAGVLQAGAEVLNTATGSQITIPTLDDTSNTARQNAEATTNSNVTEPTLGTKQLDAYKFESDWIKISVEMLQDNEYNLEGRITGIAGERLGRKLNTATTSGTGSSQINGFVTASSVGKTAAAQAAITWEEIVDLEHSVDAAYRDPSRCKFMLHDLTLAAIRKLKDSAGQYIWRAGIDGVPGRINNYGYVVNNDMDQLAAAKNVMAFGDFSKYIVRFVGQPGVVRANELFIQDGLIGYSVWQRFDGELTDTRAIKLLKTAA